jgi:hypothetical protein
MAPCLLENLKRRDPRPTGRTRVRTILPRAAPRQLGMSNCSGPPRLDGAFRIGIPMLGMASLPKRRNADGAGHRTRPCGGQKPGTGQQDSLDHYSRWNFQKGQGRALASIFPGRPRGVALERQEPERGRAAGGVISMTTDRDQARFEGPDLAKSSLEFLCQDDCQR